MRRETAIFFSVSADSSGNPYTQPGLVRWAVEVSIITVSSLSTRDTASFAAASGRHRKAISAEFIAAFLAPESFLNSSGRRISSMSFRSSSLSYILKPVVPALPSMNTFVIFQKLRYKFKLCFCRSRSGAARGNPLFNACVK